MQTVEARPAARVELTLALAARVETALFEGSVASRALGRKTGDSILGALGDALVVWLSVDEAKRGQVWQPADAGDVAHVLAVESLDIRFVVARALRLPAVHLSVSTAVHHG